MAEEAWEKGYSVDNLDFFVCSSHIDHPEYKIWIDSEDESAKNCSICDNNARTVSLEDLMERLFSCITRFYDHPEDGASYDGREGGYLITTYETDELLFEVLGLSVDEVLQTEIEACLGDRAWCDHNFHHDSESSHLTSIWSQFEKLVKETSRYVFEDQEVENDIYLNPVKPSQILYYITDYIKELSLVESFKTNTLECFRARRHLNSEEVKTVKEIGSPPSVYASANRFSAEGISAFYGAKSELVAVKEVGPPSTSELISTAKFTNHRELRLVDLSKVRVLSKIDVENHDLYYPSEFMASFSKQISKKASGSYNSAIEYAPTQIVTEFIRFVLPELLKVESIDGLIYTSSRVHDEVCYVIFANNEECADAEETNDSTIMKLVGGPWRDSWEYVPKRRDRFEDLLD